MHVLYLPRQGQTMERGTVVRWIKNVGEPFQVGDPLYELEYEKASLDIEAKLPGTLAAYVAKEGESLPVGALLAVVADPGEMLSETQIKAAIAGLIQEGAVVGQDATPAAVSRTEPSAATPGGAKVRAMPKARALAAELGIDLTTISGTGSNGSITVEDVQAAASASRGPRVRGRRQLRGIPLAMADSMTRSWTQAPQFVQIALVDASSLVSKRQREAEAFRNEHGFDLTYTDLVLRSVVEAARAVPEANSTFAGDSLVLYDDVNLGVAVATNAGLVVPVIKQAQTLSPGDLARRLRELTTCAREGSLVPEDVNEGTITVSNLGREGPEFGTPLLMPPQAAIVFVGAMVERPVVVGGQVVARPTFYVSCAFDHRVLDGATAARFMASLKQSLETP